MADIANTSTTQSNTQSSSKKEQDLQPHMYRYKVVTFTIETPKDEDYREQKYLIPLDPTCIRVIKLICTINNALC
jgi:hypothetical protein